MKILIVDERTTRAKSWPHRLAARIVDQAFKDARSRNRTRAERDCAREFLAGSAMLRYWCHVGALDERGIIARAKRVTRPESRPLLVR